MRMIPNTPYSTNSRAEKRVFDRLRSANFDGKQSACTAFHSLNLTRHAKKRFGEIDFLILCPQGIFVLEVKGGGVSCKNGIWYTKVRGGQLKQLKETPFHQAETALHGLMNRLKEKFHAHIINQFSIGYGVIFPDCEWTIAGSEWDRHTIADIRSYKNMEHWLRKLFHYRKSKDKQPRLASADAVKQLRQYLRPEFETATPLYQQVQQAEEKIAKLTEDQMAMVDIVYANSRVMCSGGAGTGKTFLALELARRWTASNQNVLLACRSPWLKYYLESHFTMPKLTVSLVESVKTAKRRTGVSYFDALIVDEGQDIFEIDSLDALDNVLDGGLMNGRWCIFHDINNQSGLLGKPQQEAIDYLESAQPAHVPLSTNCRNTHIILDKVKTDLGADMGIKGAGEGPKIREQTATTQEEAGQCLSNEFKVLIDQGGLSPSEITILSPYDFSNSSAQILPGKIKRRIICLDEYSIKSFPPNEISSAQIKNFKGLENEAIIMVDLPSPDKNDQDLTEHYVAMSRARSVLSLIYTDYQ